MGDKGQIVFLLLILSQGAHSIEEYVTKLYAVFSPARFVSSLVSDNLALGFAVANALVAFELLCWVFPVRLGWRTARGFAWFLGDSGPGQQHQSLDPCVTARELLS